MPTRFTIDLDDEDDARLKRLTDDLGNAIGRVPSHRGQRYPSRADLIRAVLAVTERTRAFRDAVYDEVRADVERRTSREHSGSAGEPSP